MNNSMFLSDSLKNSLDYKVEIKEKFISANEIPNLDKNGFKSEKTEKYNVKNNNKYIMKSATTRKWSIKFK